MKSIHKKIIRLQARALTKAVKWIKTYRPEYPITAQERKECLPYIQNNNRRFMQAKDRVSGYSVGLKAKLLREILYTEAFNHYKSPIRGQDSRWALWWHGNTYSMKMAVFVFTVLKETGTSPNSKIIHEVIKKINVLDNSIGSPGTANFITIDSIRMSVVPQIKTQLAMVEGRAILSSGTSRFQTADELIASLDK